MIRKTLMHIKVRRFAFKRERLSVHKLRRLRWSQKNLNARSGFVPVAVPSSDRTMKLARSARPRLHMRPGARASFAVQLLKMSGRNVLHVMQPAMPMAVVACDAVAPDGSLLNTKFNQNTV